MPRSRFSKERISPLVRVTPVPKNARTVRGALAINSASGSLNPSVNIFNSSANPAYTVQNANSTAGNGQSSVPFTSFPLLTAQTFWWSAVVSSGSVTGANVAIAGYSI
ncbi:hypothetical protein ABIC75_000012 [Dyella japonica]|uniref:Uncharacterized protein n=1 Tax=Dyella japonica TaxID=231455 RepID=A0ABV2JNA2_9GAMM